MSSTITIQPPRTIREVWENLPEGSLAQIIENQLIMSPPPLEIHQKVLMDIVLQIGDFIKKNSLGMLRSAPYGVYLDEENILEPDISFIRKENLHKIKENGLHGAPDLVIEILSPSTAQYDKNQKKKAYEHSGVQEYWIVDPGNRKTKGYYLEEGRYGSPLELKGRIDSRVLGHGFDF